MNDLNIIKEFYKGRVVVEKISTGFLNPGHVVGFQLASSDNTVAICVEFANGDRYNVSPSDLTAL
jgi:hypothetical protein